MAELRRICALVLTALTIGVGTVACGVSTSDPTDLGDPMIAGGVEGNSGDGPPSVNDAKSAPDLVASYLKAAVESGPGQPIDRMRSFLTTKGRRSLGLDQANPPNLANPTVIRILGSPTEGPSNPEVCGVGNVCTPVTVRYQVIGVLNDQGRVDDLSDPAEKSMIFQVTPTQDNDRKPRIDGITSPAATMMISDEALYIYYHVQSIYFWDANNSRLVPDIRYVPLGLAADVRAGRIVQWLVDGPSAWLAGAERLPTGVAVKPSVQIRSGIVVVNFNQQAALGGDAAIQRLYHQLQWSLQDGLDSVRVTLEIEDKVQNFKGGPTDYFGYNESYSLAAHGTRYDIVDGKVGALSSATPPAVLAAKENQNVVYAAINRTATMAALVRTGGDGRKSLQIVREGAATTTVTFPGKSTEAGRPVWVSTDHLLIPYGGKLYSVAGDDPNPVDVTPSRVGTVRAVSLAPDGRRIALVADGQAYVTSLNFGDNPALVIGPNPRSLLAGEVNAAAVAWTSEGSLFVAGQSGAQNPPPTPAMWLVTADGVIALNQSPVLGGVVPTDVVAYPVSPFGTASSAEVYMYAGAAIYPFQSQLTQVPTLKAPFFASSALA